MIVLFPFRGRLFCFQGLLNPPGAHGCLLRVFAGPRSGARGAPGGAERQLGRPGAEAAGASAPKYSAAVGLDGG